MAALAELPGAPPDAKAVGAGRSVAVMTTETIDMAKVEQFVGQAVGELGATLNAALVVIGDRLGLYKAMAGAGALTSAELAERTGTSERYVREWLNAQAAGGYVDLRRRALHAAARARDGAGRRGQPGVPARRLPADDRGGARRAEDHRGLPQRRRRRLARALARPLRGLRALLPPRLPLEPRAVVDPGAGRRRGQAAGGRARGRRRLRPRRLDDHHGRGVSRTRSSSASTTTAGRSRPPAVAAAGASTFEVASAQDFPGDGLRPRDDVRLPARHGRPGGRRAARPRVAGRRRHVADRRAVRGRPRGGQPEPGRARVLRGLDAGLHARVAGPGGRARARRAGGRGAAARRVRRGRLHALPARGRDAVQPGARGAALIHPGLAGAREQSRARYPDVEGYVERDDVRIFYEVYGDGDPTILLLPTWSIIHSRHWKAQIPYLARHFRVVTFDGRGNGKSDRPEGVAAVPRARVRRRRARRDGRDRTRERPFSRGCRAPRTG